MSAVSVVKIILLEIIRVENTRIENMDFTDISRAGSKGTENQRRKISETSELNNTIQIIAKEFLQQNTKWKTTERLFNA